MRCDVDGKTGGEGGIRGKTAVSTVLYQGVQAAARRVWNTCIQWEIKSINRFRRGNTKNAFGAEKGDW